MLKSPTKPNGKAYQKGTKYISKVMFETRIIFTYLFIFPSMGEVYAPLYIVIFYFRMARLKFRFPRPEFQFLVSRLKSVKSFLDSLRKCLSSSNVAKKGFEIASKRIVYFRYRLFFQCNKSISKADIETGWRQHVE